MSHTPPVDNQGITPPHLQNLGNLPPVDSKGAGKVYKYRLLKDLPEYPKDCVFVLDDKGWRGYWDGGDWTIPKWLEELLYGAMPEVRDELVEWLEPIIDGSTILYDVNIHGEVKERTVYDFWGGWEGNYTFTDKEVAEEKAAQIRKIFAAPRKANK